MNAQTGFAVELLKRSAGGYAGVAAAQLMEQEPTLREQGGALAAWKDHLAQRAIELAAAMAAEEPRLFVERVLWSRKTFAARDQEERLIQCSLQCLRDVLTESLPSAAKDSTCEYLDAAIAALDKPLQPIGPSELDPARPHDRLALQYLQMALEGNVRSAISAVRDAVADGLDVQSAYVSVLLPAQREIGRLWHANEITVAEEHLVSAATRQAMAVLLHTSEQQPDCGGTLVAACVPGNAHDIGIRAMADLFQLAGWRTIYLGADVPKKDLPATVEFFQADLMLLGSTLSTQIQPAADVIRAIRDSVERPVKVMVGGAAFDEAPELAQKVGADAYAEDAAVALKLGADMLNA